jgi:hypothetical protein
MVFFMKIVYILEVNFELYDPKLTNFGTYIPNDLFIFNFFLYFERYYPKLTNFRL